MNKVWFGLMVCALCAALAACSTQEEQGDDANNASQNNAAENNSSENNSSENNSDENNSSENNSAENNSSENNSSENNSAENNSAENNSSENNAAENNAENSGEEPDPFPGCQYPAHPELPARDEVIPEMWWSVAYGPTGRETQFDLRSFYCSPEYDQYKTLVFVVVAGWCPACPEHARHLDSLATAFEDAGAFFIWMEAEDNNSRPASSEQARDLIDRYIDQGPGLRVGDAQTGPRKMFFRNPEIPAFPTVLVVRRSDMKVIASSADSELIFPTLQVARYPEANWEDPSNNVLPTNIGEPCLNDAECDAGTLITYCIPPRSENSDQIWPQGYCSAADCADDAACGAGNLCVRGSDGIGACYKGCDSDDACRRNYECGPLGFGGPEACLPR